MKKEMHKLHKLRWCEKTSGRRGAIFTKACKGMDPASDYDEGTVWRNPYISQERDGKPHTIVNPNDYMDQREWSCASRAYYENLGWDLSPLFEEETEETTMEFDKKYNTLPALFADVAAYLADPNRSEPVATAKKLEESGFWKSGGRVVAKEKLEGVINDSCDQGRERALKHFGLEEPKRWVRKGMRVEEVLTQVREDHLSIRYPLWEATGTELLTTTSIMKEPLRSMPLNAKIIVEVATEAVT